MNLGWYFKPFGKTSGAHDGALLNALEGSGLEREHMLAREAIQNSVDAKREDGHVHVRFRKETATRTRLQEISEVLGLARDGSPLHRCIEVPYLGLGKDDFFDAQLSGETSPQDVFFIEDSGTMGLGGPEVSTVSLMRNFESRYCRLLFGYGVPDDSNTSRGGSFGFGKSVYWRASNVSTVAFYSVFSQDSSTEDKHARFIVAGLYRSHDFMDRSFTGRAWFGHPSSDYCYPLTDELAHHTAGRLGFTQRTKDELGTSVMILGSDLDIDLVAEGIENHWWPRILDNELTTELLQNGRQIGAPDPKRSRRLGKYVEAYRLAQNKTEKATENAVVSKPPRSHGREVGWCSVVQADVVDFPQRETEDNETEALYPDINEVALIRAPKMVVRYHPIGSGDGVVGCFVADEKVDHILKRAEPPEHTRWDRNSNKLDEVERGRELVVRILNATKQTAQELRRRFAGQQPTPDGTPRPLGILMGSLLRTNKGGKRGARRRSGRDPFEVTLNKERIKVPGGVTLRTEAKIQLRRRHRRDEEHCLATLSAFVLKDDTLTDDVDLEILDVNVDGGTVLDGDALNPSNPNLMLRIKRNEAVVIRFRTSTFHDYAASRVSVETNLVKGNSE